jgi:hypothetical protein
LDGQLILLGKASPPAPRTRFLLLRRAGALSRKAKGTILLRATWLIADVKNCAKFYLK